jgi:hypothetical protein
MESSPSRTKLQNASNLRNSTQTKLTSHKKLPPLEGNLNFLLFSFFFLHCRCYLDNPSTQLTAGLNTTKSLQHKKDLMEALRRTNPAGVNTAPQIFWDVEGSLKTVLPLFSTLYSVYLCLLSSFSLCY